MGGAKQLLPVELIQNKKVSTRGRKAVSDPDVAEPYGFETKAHCFAIKKLSSWQ
jgi:hypothetical protein